MGKSIKPIKVSAGYAGKSYPYNKWFSKQRVVLEQGKDFDCKITSMVQQYRNAAYRRGVKVSVRKEGNKITITQVGKVR